MLVSICFHCKRQFTWEYYVYNGNPKLLLGCLRLEWILPNQVVIFDWITWMIKIQPWNKQQVFALMERRPRESYTTFEKRGKMIPTVQSETHVIHKVRKRLIHFFICLLLCSIELTYFTGGPRSKYEHRHCCVTFRIQGFVWGKTLSFL